MRNALTIDREANSIRLQRDVHRGAFLLVEGRSDKLLYGRFIKEETCKIVSVAGKPSSKLRVLAVLTNLEESKFKGVLAILDSDFDRLSSAPGHESSNAFKTDCHDIEAMLVKSPAFDNVLTEFCSREKVESFGQDVRTAILIASIPIGYLRWISQRNGLNLKFNGIKFSKFIDSKSLVLEEVSLIAEVQNKSQLSSPPVADIQALISKAKNDEHDPWQICCGHDLVEVLSIGLKQTLGSNKALDVESAKLERCLRLAYETSYWLSTQLYSDLCEWEKHNSPYKVF